MIHQPDAGVRRSAAKTDAKGQISWPELIQKIQADDASGMEALYNVFSRGVRFFLWRQLGRQDLEDTMHDTFLVVTQAIRRGEVREPDKLMGFVWTVVRRQLATQIDRTVNARSHHADIDVDFRMADRGSDPEWKAIVQQRQNMAHTLLQQVSGRDREVLIRFYLQEQPPDQICRDMQLTETQFRLLKSRAKARLSALGRKKLARRRICW